MKAAIEIPGLMPIIRRRRQQYPFLLHMGSVALSVTSVLLIGLMAVLYLSQVGQAVSANRQIQVIHTQQANLQRANQDLAATISTEQSPEYIAQHARQLGLAPADQKIIQVLVVNHLQPIPNQTQQIQP